MVELFSKEGLFNTVLMSVNEVLWGCFLVAVLVGLGLWFTFKSRFVQFRMFPEMVRLLGDTALTKKKGKHISSFQAFAVSVATRVGTGNLAGVATAIALGGPGAVFWMWLIALLGSSTSFVESTLAQLFKKPHRDSFIGGPAFYIKKGLGSRWMAVLFSVVMILTFGLSYNSVQSNTICGALQNAFGWSPQWVGLVLAAVSLAVVFGGIQRIAKVSSLVVPVMAIGYFILAIVVVAANVSLLPRVFRLIIENAFGLTQFAGGTLGATIMNGVKRGLFSNEAGEGSSPHAAATAACSHPVKQGLIQALGVFTDTLLVCSCTAFIILISGLYTQPGLQGIVLTQSALQHEIGGSGPVFVAVIITLFAWSSIIGNYYYGEANIRFLTRKKWVLLCFRVLSAGGMVLFGAMSSLDLVWNLGDFCMGCITIINLVALVRLGRYAFALLDDYRCQKRNGVKDPVFHASTLPELKGKLDWWND